MIYFLIFSVLITVIFSFLPSNFFEKDRRLFRVKNWEHNGMIYQTLFKIKKWKSRLPELNLPTPQRFKKKKLESECLSVLQTRRFIAETRRSEFCHIVIICASFIFFITEGLLMGLTIALVAIILNVPFIMIQRFNRPRLIKVVSIKDQDPEKDGSDVTPEKKLCENKDTQKIKGNLQK
jgi:glycosyl-4,4'-diaponeurosporenoate acyltransferase